MATFIVTLLRVTLFAPASTVPKSRTSTSGFNDPFEDHEARPLTTSAVATTAYTGFNDPFVDNKGP